MAITNSLKRQIDLPVFEQLRNAPAVSSLISCSCTSDNSNIHSSYSRYIYYLISATGFWRYDTWTDTYIQLTSPPITPITYSTMRFAGSIGVESNIISATSTTANIPGYFDRVFKSFDIKIISGTGAGQRRIINNVSEVISVDMGVPTTVANVLGGITITDTTKNWAINQYKGYQVRIISGTGVGQVRKILYNSATVLTLGDSVISSNDPYCNPGIFSPAIVTTAGAQSVYQIEYSIITVDTAWAITPDSTSRYRVEGGTVYLLSGAAATPFYTLQQYDVLTDTWYIKTANTLNIAAVGTDSSIERTGENSSIWERGTSTITGTTTTLVDSTKNWVINQWTGFYLRIWSGTGEDQLALISSNTATTLTVATMALAPTTTSQYFIEGFEAGIASGAGSTTTLVDPTKNWDINRWKNYMVRIQGGTGKGQVVQILSNTATTLTFIKAISIATDATSTYTIQGDIDKLYISLGNNAGILIHNFNDDLASYGRLQDSGVANNASVQFSTNKPFAISSVSNITTTATITTAITHNYKVGQSITIKGCANANYNGTFTIVTVPSLTTFTYTMGGTPVSNTLNGSQSVTTLSDTTKNWTINQWTGYMVYMNTTAVTAASGLATGQCLQIVSNTATTLTFVTGTAPLNGVSRYIIAPRDAIGAMFNGLATGTQSTTTLQDTNASGVTVNGSITGNILTVSSLSGGYLGIGTSFTGTGGVEAGTTIINFGANTNGGIGTYTVSRAQTSTLTSAAAGWSVNFFAGRKLKMIGSTGQSIEVSITSNTNNTLTFALTTAPVTLVTSYVILQQPNRGTGIELNWGFGTSDSSLRGKYLWIPRGGATQGFDYVELTNDKIEQSSISPQIETLTAGSMYAYDGVDRIYFTKEATQRLYYLDIVTNQIHGAGFYPYLAGTATIGNRMEIFSTIDGLKYLWLNRHSNLECFRELLFY